MLVKGGPISTHFSLFIATHSLVLSKANSLQKDEELAVYFYPQQNFTFDIERSECSYELRIELKLDIYSTSRILKNSDSFISF